MANKILMKTFFPCNLILLGLSVFFFACRKEIMSQEPDYEISRTTRAVVPSQLDWEYADWMPTPPGQSRIPSPWVGAGSLTPAFGIDIVNDRFRSNGWELVYNTFDADSPGPLVNPYFVLYNKYNGLLRIYFYLTTEFVTTSSYLLDRIEVISNRNCRILNFLGQETLDPSISIKNYSQIQAKSSDISPLAANKWYMLQYEMAYDPDLASVPCQDIQLAWHLGYINISEVSLGGESVGTINGTIGGASTSGQSYFPKFTDAGKYLGTGVLAGVGMNIIDKNTINAATGENKLGLPKSQFKSLADGLKKAFASASGSLPGAIVNAVFSLFSGESSSPIPVNLQIQTQIKLSGNISEQGSFPSSPTTFWVPGTSFGDNVVGYVPLYNKSLGIVGIIGEDSVECLGENHYGYEEDPYGGRIYDVAWTYLYFTPKPDYSHLLAINPEVQAIANISVKQEFVVTVDDEVLVNPTRIYWDDRCIDDEYMIHEPEIIIPGVRFTIEIKPKNGDTASTIVKTVKLNNIYSNTTVYHPYDFE